MVSLYADDEMFSFFSVKEFVCLFVFLFLFFSLRNRRKLLLPTVIKTRQNFKRYTVQLFVAYNRNQLHAIDNIWRVILNITAELRLTVEK